MRRACSTWARSGAALRRPGVQPPAPVDTDRVVAWRQGWLVFDQQPLSQVVDELNRYRRGHLVLMNEQLGKRLVQARISLAQIADAEN